MHMTLRACGGCSGLVPTTARTCVHCDVPLAAPSALRRVLGTAAGIVGGGAFMATLMACYGRPHGPPGDNDKDGFANLPGKPIIDCDDNNPRIHPGQADVVGDGKDFDCDGTDGPGQAKLGPIVPPEGVGYGPTGTEPFPRQGSDDPMGSGSGSASPP